MKKNKLQDNKTAWIALIVIAIIVLVLGATTERTLAKTKMTSGFISITDCTDSSGVKEKVGDYYIWIEQSDTKYKLKCAKKPGGGTKTITSVKRSNYGWMFESVVTNGNTIFYAKKDKQGKFTIYKTSVKGGEGVKVKSVKQLSHLVGYYDGKLYYNTVTGKGIYGFYSYDITKKKTKQISSKCYTYSSNGRYIICLNDKYYDAKKEKFVKVPLSDEGRAFYTDGSHIYYWEAEYEASEGSIYQVETGETLKRCSMTGKNVKSVKTFNYDRYEQIHFGSGNAFFKKNDGKIYKFNYKSEKLTSFVWSLAKVKLTSVKSTDYDKITVKWNKVSNAKKYQVYRSTSKKGKYKLVKTTAGTTYKNAGLVTGKKYYYKVRAINGTIKGGYSGIKYAKTTLDKPEAIEAIEENCSIKIIWEEVDGATGYELYRSTKESGTYKKITSTIENNFTDYSAKEGVTYYYKLIASKDTTKSKYSDIVSCMWELDLESIRLTMIEMINQERQAAGVSPVKKYDPIHYTAQEKAEDLYETGVFDHYSANLGWFYNQFESIGVTYSGGSENISSGFPNVEDVMTGWMQSPKHKENILNEEWTHVGIGYYKGNWVQQFAMDPKGGYKVCCETGMKVDCIHCGAETVVEEYKLYTTDAEENVYGLFTCTNCEKFMDKCPKCEPGIFVVVGLSDLGTTSSRCNNCGHNQDENCYETCQFCNSKFLNNTMSVRYKVAFDSTGTYDGKSFDKSIPGFYFQHRLFTVITCKTCKKHVLITDSECRDYTEFYENLKNTLGSDEHIFEYIKWEKYVSSKVIASGENWATLEETYEFIDTPKFTSLDQILGVQEFN